MGALKGKFGGGGGGERLCKIRPKRREITRRAIREEKRERCATTKPRGARKINLCRNASLRAEALIAFDTWARGGGGGVVREKTHRQPGQGEAIVVVDEEMTPGWNIPGKSQRNRKGVGGRQKSFVL